MSAALAFLRSRPWALALAGAVALAFALRLAWVLFAQTEPAWPFDPFVYNRLGASLAGGDGFTYENGEPTACCPPGYPFALAALYTFTGESPLAAELLNVALGAASVAPAYHIAARLFGRAAALIAAFALAVFPSHVVYASQLHTEVVFTFLLLAALSLWLAAGEAKGRGRWAAVVAGGAVFGFAVLVRPVALPLLLAAPLAVRAAGADWRPALRSSALAGLVALVVIAPWVARNAATVGVPAISTNTGINLWIGNHQGASGLWAAPAPWLFPNVPGGLTDQERADYERGIDLARDFVLDHPGEALALLPKKLHHLYTNDGHAVAAAETWGAAPFLSDAGRAALRFASDAFYWLVVAGAVASLFRPGGRWKAFALSVFALWTAAHLAFFGEPRFHVPVTPLMAVMAAYGWPGALALARERLPSFARPPVAERVH